VVKSVEKKKSVAGQFAVKYKTVLMESKTNQGTFRGTQVLGTYGVVLIERVTAEKQ
jgi:hypothetical protein